MNDSFDRYYQFKCLFFAIRHDLMSHLGSLILIYNFATSRHIFFHLNCQYFSFIQYALG